MHRFCKFVLNTPEVQLLWIASCDDSMLQHAGTGWHYGEETKFLTTKEEVVRQRTALL